MNKYLIKERKMSTYCDSNKSYNQYKYRLIIDNLTYEYNKKKDLVMTLWSHS